MAASTPTIDAIGVTATLTRLLRLIDQQARCSMDDQLGLAELGVLGAIERGIELPSAIARSMRLDPARVTRIVDFLVTQQYVERGVDAHDRRRCPVSLTVAGHDALEAGRTLVAGAMGGVIEKLPAARQRDLAQTLDALREVIDSLPG